MKRTLPWLLVLLLSGCLGTPDSSSPDPPPAGDTPVGGDEEVEVPEEESPHTPVPTGLSMDLEGIECKGSVYLVPGPSEKLQPHVPPGFEMGGNIANLITIVHQCRSAVLGPDQLGRDVSIAIAYARVDPPGASDSTDLNIYLLEAFTDWPAAVQAWAADGVKARQATFSHSDGVLGVSITIAAEDLEYHFQPALPTYYPTNKTSSEFSLYAGNGTQLYDYALTYQGFDVLPRSAVVTARGGLLEEFTGGAAVALTEAGSSSLVLRPKP